MIALRPAVLDDAYPLWLWANDPESRAASGDRAIIPWAAHLLWYHDRLESPNALILIAEGPDRQPVGVIRFETTDGWRAARSSYGVAPESRGAGIGWELLTEGIAELRRRSPGVVIEASVRAANPASLRLFERLRWRSEPSRGDHLLFRSSTREAP